MIEAVLFDFGGVITTSPFDAFARYEAEVGLPAGLIRRINSTNPNSNAWAKLERSEIDRRSFCELFEREGRTLGYEVSAERVLACLRGELRPAMVAAVETLGGHFKTAILTNNLVGHEESSGVGSPTGDMHEVVGFVDAVVESSRVGVRKPEPEFYRLACELLEVEPARCAFLDDLGINLKPARELGMATIKVVTEDQALNELEALVGMTLR